MRALLVLVGLAAVILVALMFFGIINIDQTRPGVVQAPTFKADVAKVRMGTEEKTVTVPTMDIDKPGNAN
ncbi:hypothetical protein [Sphingomonas sp.]|jgi:hypothetical protein|uniref:hypothetical protein n=1 Tax=Sphingomonas sp. TaxID=28214 RepID=UPI002ED79D3E